MCTIDPAFETTMHYILRRKKLNSKVNFDNELTTDERQKNKP